MIASVNLGGEDKSSLKIWNSVLLSKLTDKSSRHIMCWWHCTLREECEEGDWKVTWLLSYAWCWRQNDSSIRNLSVAMRSLLPLSFWSPHSIKHIRQNIIRKSGWSVGDERASNRRCCGRETRRIDCDPLASWHWLCWRTVLVSVKGGA